MWLSKLALGGILAVATMTSAAVAPTAEAHGVGFSGPQAHDPHHQQYEVYYRHNHHDAWHFYSTYHSHGAAHHAADHLRARGYLVRVHHHG